MSILFAKNGHLAPYAFSPRCWEALQYAREVARLGGWDNLRTPHAFIGIAHRPDAVISRWAEYAGIDLFKLGEQMSILFRQESGYPRSECCPLHREFCSNSFIKLLQDAQSTARGKFRTQISEADLAGVILADGESVVYGSLSGAGLSCVDLATLLAAAEQAEHSARSLA